MRKLVLFFLVIISLTGLAQNKKLSFGPKVGLNLGVSLPHGKPEAGTIDSSKGAPLMGPNLGVFFLYNFNPKWSVWVEANYNRKGMQYSSRVKDLYYVDVQCINLPNGDQRCAETETTFSGTTWGRFDNYYFEIPIMARYSFNPKWHVVGGIYNAALLRSSSEANYDGYPGASHIKVHDKKDLSDQTAAYDSGIKLGFQYQYQPILVDFRLSYGLTSIFKESYKPITYPVRNVFAELSVAFQFFRYKPEE